MINGRHLFPINFNIDKQLIHYAGNALIFKRLMSHHMTPMTSGITYTQENGFILIFSFIEGFFSPGIPFYRIIFMLLQVRAMFVFEFIRHVILVYISME